MGESIKHRLKKFESGQEYELRLLLEANLTDLTNLSADLAALAAKLDADTGVTDADYAAGLTSGTLNLEG